MGNTIVALKNKQAILDSFQLGEANRPVLEFLLQSENDYEDFMKYFWGKQREFFAITDFRLFKQILHRISFAAFDLLYTHQPIRALETLFQQFVTHMDVKMLESCIMRGRLTLLSLYEKHLRFPEKFLISMIL